jgi:hypothetical protein
LTPAIGEKNKLKFKKIRPRITEIVNKNGLGRSRKLTEGRSNYKELGNLKKIMPQNNIILAEVKRVDP